MRFDICPFFRPGEDIPWTETIRMMREQARLAEEAGFTTAWFTEHHFAHKGYLNAPPNPILVSADIAAHCKKIRVGQAPVVLPDWHPLRVAEDIALLDNMTDGRVDFGAAKGVNERGCIQLNPEADKRDDKKVYSMFRECLDIIIKAWTEDPFSYEGDFYQFPVPGWKETNRMFFPLDKRYFNAENEYIGMYIHPRPVQKPHPPVWLMSNTPFTYEFAGKNHSNVIGMCSSKDNLNACWDAYKLGAESSGREGMPGTGVGTCVIIYVANTMEEAAKTIRPSINKYYEYVAGARPGDEWAKASMLNPGEDLSQEDAEKDWFDFLMSRGIIWVGSPDYVGEKLQEYNEDASVNHIMLLQQFPDVSYESIIKSQTMFSEQVLPRFSLDMPRAA
tara:strand:+ start:2222 stop:3391 length:1170 start_codon:yes stop_codon:yes gene_type:complete